jgi:hypothetical protein
VIDPALVVCHARIWEDGECDGRNDVDLIPQDEQTRIASEIAVRAVVAVKKQLQTDH